jgi:hypothetical protein
MALSERSNDTPRADSAPSPHPLAVELAEAIRGASDARLFLLGIGNGRNVPPFLEAGVAVDAIERDAERARSAASRFAGVRVVRGEYAGPYPFTGAFAGALSTSALLHGTAGEVASAVAAVRACLRPGARFFATFGSTRDPRFGRGLRIDDATFAPAVGSEEEGVPHAYFDEARLRALFDGFAEIDARELDASETVGRWAHSADAAAGIVHWFVRARRDAAVR